MNNNENENENEDEILNEAIKDLNSIKLNKENDNHNKINYQYPEGSRINMEKDQANIKIENQLYPQNAYNNKININNNVNNNININKYNKDMYNDFNTDINDQINNQNLNFNNHYYIGGEIEGGKQDGIENINNMNNINNNELLNINNDFINNDNYLNEYNNELSPENQELFYNENRIIDDNLLYNENNTENINTINSINQNQNFTLSKDTNDYNELNDIKLINNNINNINNFNTNYNNFIDKINNINDLESLKIYIINLGQKCNYLQKENKKLKMQNVSKINSTNGKNPNYDIIENSIRQGTILLDDVKSKNNNLNKKIKILENKNKKLNYKLIEISQKLKRIQNDQKNPLLQKINKNINSNNNKLNMIEIQTNFSKLNNKIDETDIIISKLKFDKKTLQLKLEETKIFYENELKLMLNYKNSELSAYQKAIDKFKQQISDYSNNNILNNNKFYPNNSRNDIQKLIEYENKINSLTNKLSNSNLNKKTLENKIYSLKNNLIEKDNTINTLNKRIIETEGNFNLKLLEIQKDTDENKEQFNQVIKERDDLIKKNQELSNGLLQVENKIKEANLIFINKTEFYNKNLKVYKNKINDYKNKIIILKKKINQLYLVIEKMKINNPNFEFNHKINKQFHKNTIPTPGTFNRNRRMTSFSKRYFRDNDDLSLFNINNKRNNISFFDDKNYDNISNFGISKDIYNGNIYDVDKGKKNYDILDNKLNDNQKLYLENYKTFLSGLDFQFNP